MTTHSPLRCSRSTMTQRGTNEVVLLDTGNYPAFSNFLNETWTWNGTDWTNTGSTLIDAAGPLPGRVNHVMSYDGYNVMLYGGQGDSATSGVAQDTWVWNGTSWSKKSPATVPFGRYKAEACRLTTTSNIAVMFGGFGGANSFLNETWEWDGYLQNWSLQAPATSPPGRVDFCMAAGPTYLLMFGGSNSNSQLNDTWKYDGSTWTNLAPAAAPSVRNGACMAYDVTHSVWVLFGGVNEYNYLPETWKFNGTTWSQATPAVSPPGLNNAQMCWDTQTGKVLLFGGISATDGTASNTTYTYDGTVWAAL